MKKEFDNRTEYYNEAGELHRLDGPAIIYNYGTKCWYINGKRHRADGPAIEWIDGLIEYWINGEELTTEEFTLYKFANNIQ